MMITTATTAFGAATSTGTTSGAATSGQSFDTVLSGVAPTAGIGSGKKPNVAQFMALTGADAKTAIRALYQYKNWASYLNGSTPAVTTTAAQTQIKSEISDGSRRLAGDGQILAQSAFVRPDLSSARTTGQIAPVFNPITNQLVGVHVTTSEGRGSFSTFTNKDLIQQQAHGFGIGTAALDEFAKKFGYNSFQEMDLYDVKTAYPDRAAWEAKFGADAIT